MEKFSKVSQLNWTIAGQQGKNYKVGLYHGDKTGHLLVHCNFKVLLVDFNVRETRSYSFFIEDEFCDLTVENKNGHFEYSLELNKTIDTPLNRERNSRNKKHLLQSVGFFFALLFIGVLVVVFVPDIQKKRMAASQKLWLEKSRDTTIAEINRIDSQGKNWSYTFVADGKAQTFQISSEVLSKDSSLHFPFENGDDIAIIYAIHNPGLHHFDQNQISKKQVSLYVQRAAAVHLQSHPDLRRAYLDCLLRLVFETKGIGGLADFYFQNQKSEHNPRHNENTFSTLSADPEFKKLSLEKCGE